MDLTQFYRQLLQLAEEPAAETVLQVPQVVLAVVDIIIIQVAQAQQTKVMQVPQEQIQVARTVQVAVVALDKHRLNQLPMAVELAVTEF
jgi:uncharacterized membrane protein (Fun14 family)